ncbi:elongation of very long chain fatty acids protein 7-like isoform X1 [Sitodiplosis mosellana]|uniref:elongation of very long chain fatty acids protein 7-like isoform X1 n=1 Tax=Sitodiplosis mosellana TaxID=263140 RepID=UPI0024438379|nr:elongation of very long chain fatty acids protein 7-like isoform X1 [Sitodiplosis mosellana]
MALVIKKIVDYYFYLNDEISDPRVRDMLFMSNPFTMFAILAVYLCFILKWGPEYMKNRKPFNINKIIIVYNIIQIVACARLVAQALQHVYKFRNGYSFLCEPVDWSSGTVPMIIANGCHTYFLLKVVDLLDTVFFVLRKKDKQISFLHLYHHTGMVILTWNATKFYPGGHSIFTGFINSIIHVVMYSYYLVSAFQPQYKNNLWWKKYITQLQIIQFFLIMVHWLALLFQSDCGFPKFPVAIMVPQNLFMLALFGDFYYKTYVQERKPRKKHDDKGDNDDNSNNSASSIAIDSNNNNNGTIKTMANGNGITCRNNVNNYYSSGSKANGISISS